MPHTLHGRGFALICDDAGIIQRIIQNEHELTREPAAGMRIVSFFDEACAEKVLLFLEEARSAGSAFDWELVLALTSGAATQNCAAAYLDGRLLVVGSSSRDSTVQVIEEMLKINNEQTNHLRVLMKELQKTSQQMQERDHAVYGEFTRLNNQLTTIQRELVKKNHELEELNLQKNYFLGMAAHDLRSPLGTIISFSEYLLDQDREHTLEDDRELVKVIKRSSEFMFGLINDLLDITKIESGNLCLNLLPQNLSDLVSQCGETARVLASKKEIEILIGYEGPLPESVVWDAPKIEQVLNNLLGNAIKFSHPGSVVKVLLSCDGHNVVLRCEDMGEGLPAELLDQLFVPFSKASRLGTRGEKGTGLGLAIVRRIVEGHGGCIRAENMPDRGTRFTVTLPIGGA